MRSGAENNSGNVRSVAMLWFSAGALGVIVLCAAGCGGRSAERPGEPAAPTATAAIAAPQPALVWDAHEKVITPAFGDTSAGFQFTVTNVSDHPVTIEQLRPTCGCTIAEMPSVPWVLASKESGTFIGSIEFRGQSGTLRKALFVNSTAGTQMLTLVVRLPEINDSTRRENRRIAQRDRQAVLKGNCAKCHYPNSALTAAGGELFTDTCGVCHLSGRRDAAVPDLLHAWQHRDREFWRKWITEGRGGSMMPAWSKEHGGPLSDAQVDSLVEFALQNLPTEPAAAD